MSLEKLKRDLISCGKEFFIDNYFEIKKYSEGKLSKSEVDSFIRSKQKWQNISTHDNRISAVKMIFENKLAVDALKITINSRAKGDVTNKAKDIFENEVGRKFNGDIDRVEGLNSINLLPEILQALEEDQIIDLCAAEEFRFQKGTDKLIEFENFNDLSEEEISSLLAKFIKSDLTFTKFIETLDKGSKEYIFLTITGQLISYCDVHAANKSIYNEYEDKRTLAKAGVRMNDWITKLLTYRIANNNVEKLTPSIKNAINFLKNPVSGLTMLSENHRERFSAKYLKKSNYNPNTIVEDLISFFEPYEIYVANEKNRTLIYCSVLYSDVVKNLWLDNGYTELEQETMKIKNYEQMNIPLNQIFYGPPGTGKTYNISREATKIVNKTWSMPSTINQKFSTICKYLYNLHKFEDKSNSLYKTEKAILWILGYIIKYEEFNDSNSINKEDAIKHGFDNSPSGWSQQTPFLTDFNFAEYTKSTVALDLNESGIKLKNDAIAYLNDHKLNADVLIQWEKGKQDTVAPEFIQNAYYEKILKTTEDTFSPTLSTIYSTLNFLLNEPFFPSSQTLWTDASEELRSRILVYYNPTKPEGDIKWICQFARVLYGLGLIKKENDNYYLNEKGFKLINDIILRWGELKPELFSEVIQYENAVSLGFIEFITFHQSYSYEEFIEGIRPKLDNDANLSYSLEPGIFKRIADKAKEDKNNNYVIIIDEINRGNISKIFGELITLIEPSKRLFSDDINEHPKQVTLPYSKKLFGVPKNLYILGTMNTADKSIALLDSALRRRFSFTEMSPKSEIVEQLIKIENIDIKLLFETINNRIEFLIDKDHTIGHSYFLKIINNQSVEGLALIFKNEIIPLLTEYFYGDFEKIQLILGDNKDWKSESGNKFFIKKLDQQKTLFGKDELIEGFDEKKVFSLNEDLFGLNEDGTIKGKKEDLLKLFISVYTLKSK